MLGEQSLPPTLVADTTRGTCRPLDAIDPGIASPIASLSKLYVLDAPGDAIEAGKLRWNTPLPHPTDEGTADGPRPERSGWDARAGQRSRG
jgi:hypothetical protein